MKPEHRFRQSIVKHLKGVYVWSIHDSYQAGVPDHYYSAHGADLWAEYKFFKTDRDSFNLLLPTKTPKLSRLQQNWLQSRHDEGRTVWVIVGMPSGGVILYGDEWNKGEIRVATLLSRKQIAAEIMQACA